MRDRNEITSIIEYYDNAKTAYRSLYSDVFESNAATSSSASSNLNKIANRGNANSFKYNTWEITGEHDGVFEKKVDKKAGMSYFSKNPRSSGKFRTKNVLDAEVKPNMFREAIKRNSDIISSVDGEEMRFKRFEQYMSMEVKGVKKIFDIFEVYNSCKTVKLTEKKTFLQRISGFFKSKK